MQLSRSHGKRYLLSNDVLLFSLFFSMASDLPYIKFNEKPTDPIPEIKFVRTVRSTSN